MKDFKNTLCKLADCRQFEEMVSGYVEETNTLFTCFAIDGNTLYLSIQPSVRTGELDMGVVNDMVKMFNLPKGKQVADNEIWYELVTTDIKFSIRTVGLVWCSTPDGFILNEKGYDDCDMDEVKEFLTDNPDFSLYVKEGKVILGCR